MKNTPNLWLPCSKGFEIMSKLYDLLGAIISCVKNTASAIPKKLSELENDAGFITEQKQADWNQNNPEAADRYKQQEAELKELRNQNQNANNESEDE